jgi:hypothetical protein
MTTKAQVLTAVRAACLACCCGSPAEVGRCSIKSCSLLPFRMGKDPNPARSSPGTPFGKNARPGPGKNGPASVLENTGNAAADAEEAAPCASQVPGVPTP